MSQKCHSKEGGTATVPDTDGLLIANADLGIDAGLNAGKTK
jgi:hypothetical protein